MKSSPRFTPNRKRSGRGARAGGRDTGLQQPFPFHFPANGGGDAGLPKSPRRRDMAVQMNPGGMPMQQLTPQHAVPITGTMTTGKRPFRTGKYDCCAEPGGCGLCCNGFLFCGCAQTTYGNSLRAAGVRDDGCKRMCCLNIMSGILKGLGNIPFRMAMVFSLGGERGAS